MTPRIKSKVKQNKEVTGGGMIVLIIAPKPRDIPKNVHPITLMMAAEETGILILLLP